MKALKIVFTFSSSKIFNIDFMHIRDKGKASAQQAVYKQKIKNTRTYVPPSLQAKTLTHAFYVLYRACNANLILTLLKQLMHIFSETSSIKAIVVGSLLKTTKRTDSWKFQRRRPSKEINFWSSFCFGRKSFFFVPWPVVGRPC